MKKVPWIWLLLVGCAGTPAARPADASLAAARRAEAAGRHQEASLAYDKASREATTDKDRSSFALAAARSAERAGDTEGSQMRYEAIAHLRLLDAPAALMRLAARRQEAGDMEGARAWWTEMLRAHPNDGLATRALFLYLRDEDSKPDACVGRLEAMKPVIGGAPPVDLAEALAYAKAQCLDAQGKGREAIDAYLAVTHDFPPPSSHYGQESLLRAAELLESYGDTQGAIQRLRELLVQREHASTIGSYEKPGYAIALSRIARLYDEKLHDVAAAKKAWTSLYEDFPDSRLRDDAAFEAALLDKRDGGAQAACKRLQRLKDAHPSSRYVRCISAWCGDKATTTCSDYLQRRWDGSTR